MSKLLFLSITQKKSILASFAHVYKEDNYPPIAGKILGFFYISNEKYFTFDELMIELKVSKSAMSKALKLLLEFGEVNFKIFENNKRKRYFYLDIQGTIDKLQRLIDAYFMETQLLEETLKIRNNENKDLNEFIKISIKFNKEVLDYLEKKVKEHYKIIK